MFHQLRRFTYSMVSIEFTQIARQTASEETRVRTIEGNEDNVYLASFALRSLHIHFEIST